MSKTIAGRCFVFAVLVLLLAGGCSKEVPPPGGASERLQREEAQLRQLATRHNACVDWIASLPDRGSPHTQFTIDLKRALVRTNNEPVGIVAQLVDVSERNGVFTAQFTAFVIKQIDPIGKGPRFRVVSLRLDLLCSQPQAEDLLSVRTEVPILDLRFAIVVRVDSVVRPSFHTIPSETGDTFEFDPGDVPDVFCVKGTCVDLVRLLSPIE